jgi:predicted NACHT family NTPase
MIRQGFGWQRFWCPTTGNLTLDYSGFLYDPESEYGNSYNPDLVKFDVISDIPCLILLGEAGIGKTIATKQEYKRLEHQLQHSEDECLWFSLGDYGSDDSLCNAIFRNEQFKAWLNGTYKLHLFLDSLDEGILSIKTLTRILRREIDKLPCNQDHRLEHPDRLYLRITCRTADWKDTLREKFREKWGENNLGIYELCPLRQIDVEEYANQQGIDAKKFLKELADKQAIPLAIKPITLKFLLSTYIKNNSFPLSQKELYEQGCLELCKEANPDRLDCNFKGKLSDKQRFIVAGRIAAITIFANKIAIWTSPDYLEMPKSDIAIQNLCIGKEKIDGQEIEVTEDCVREVLSISGLFSSRGTNRMGFAHKTYAEFLAAWYLTQHQIPLVQIMSLIVSPEDAARKLVPQLHETAAWLASMSREVSQEIMTTDPDVLLYSDVSEDGNLRESIVSNLLEQYEQEKLFDRGFANHSRYKKLKHPKLEKQLRSYIQDTNKNFNARYEAINIAEVCGIKELQDDLVNLALDKTQQIYLRSNAANAIVSIGDSNTRLKLKPLAIKELPEDEVDELKGYALKAVWSENLTAKELFSILNRPKKFNFTGSYRIFLDYEILPRLEVSDILIALNWLEKQGVRCFGHPFENLGNSILLKAWEHFDNPKIVKGFAKAALVQLQEHQPVITFLNRIGEKTIFSISINDDKRRKLIEELISITDSSENSIHILVACSSDNIFLQKDIFWALERIQTITDKKIQDKYIALIKYSFNHQDTKQIEALINAAKTNQIIEEHFAPWFQAIELNSPLAEERKEQYSKEIEYRNRIEANRNKPTLTTSPKERVLNCLDLLEAGNLDSWWQLCREMTLVPNYRHYGSDFEYDLTKLPGWKEADISTQNRIVDAAKKYLLEQKNIKYDWIGTNNYCRSALAGAKAFLLLLSLVLLSKESPEFLNSLSAETWQKWTPIIVGSPDNSNRKEPYLDLVKLAYEKAPSEAIDTLIVLIDSENKDSDYIRATRQFKKCWDERLMSTVLEQAKISSLKPSCMGYLLEELLERDYAPAKDFVKSLITYPLPLTEEARKRAIIAAQILMINATSDLWSVFWSTLQEDKTFGCEVLESTMSHNLRGNFFDLTEEQVADFYIWLTKEYPHDEDPVFNSPEAHCVGTRESIGNLRDNILNILREWGTPQACQEIQRIANQFPELDWLKITLSNAQKNRRTKTWQPPKPAEILKLVSDRNQRLVNDGNELLDVLIESLQRLETELQGETPAARDIWDQTNAKPLKYKPVDENTFSSYVKRFLDDDLKQRGIIANREVELRPSQGGAPGERTDIHIDAVVKNANGEIYDSITVIIEVKGCWHKELNSAMETQLVGRYLKENTCQHGLYLIGWFNCDQWDSSDSRKGKSPKISIKEAKEQFNRQVEQFSLSGVRVKSFVLNTALK